MSTSKLPKATIARLPEEKKADIPSDVYNNWLTKLYDTSLITPKLFTEFYDTIKYNGFNREDNLSILMKDVEDVTIVHEIILAGALRGPVKGALVTLSNGRTPEKMGIPSSRMKGRKNLSMNKVVASTADLAAYILKQCGVPKRVNSNLPAWLQFPSAGSIKMPDEYRVLHREFSKSFSSQIGGAFNDQIYTQMEVNAYLDPRLQLFI
jgi:hypothetical protein